MKSDVSTRTSIWYAAVVIVVSLSLQVYGHRCGLLFTPDSHNYVSAAISFKTDGTFLSPDGSFYTYWPPLFPVTLALFNSPDAVPWMYAVATILIGIITMRILTVYLKNNLLKILVLFLTLTSVQFMMISVFLWSEINFLLLTLCVVYCALNLKKARVYFFGLLAAAFLMCLQRNAGVFILGGVSCWMALDKTRLLKIRVVESTLLFVVGVSGLIVWNIYLSVIIDSGFYVYKHEFFIHALNNFSTVAAMLIRIVVPVSGQIVTVLGLGMLVALIVHIRRSTSAVQLIGLLVLFYWLGLVCMFKLDVNDVDRFLSPIILFIYLLVMEWLEKFSMEKAKPVKIVVTVVVFIWMVYPVYRTVTNLQQWHGASCEAAQK